MAGPGKLMSVGGDRQRRNLWHGGVQIQQILSIQVACGSCDRISDSELNTEWLFRPCSGALAQEINGSGSHQQLGITAPFCTFPAHPPHPGVLRSWAPWMRTPTFCCSKRKQGSAVGQWALPQLHHQAQAVQAYPHPV